MTTEVAALATPAMFVVVLAMRQSLVMSRSGHALALLLGATQFCGNFNFVYRAEEHLTSGVVAVMFGMLMVPNALLARWWLGQQVTPRFLAGSAIAIAGKTIRIVFQLSDFVQTIPVPRGPNIHLCVPAIKKSAPICATCSSSTPKP